MSIERKVTIGSKTGLHARPAALVVKEASRFQSQIELVTAERQASLKSLISVMSLGVKQGSEVTLRVSGPDEAEAADALAAMLARDLD